MVKDKMVVVSIKYPRYYKEYSASISDESTWHELLDVVVGMLHLPGGYHITRDKLINWAKETEEIEEI